MPVSLLTRPSVPPGSPHSAPHGARRQPFDCGDLPFTIRRDGTWMYQGSPIGRKELVCLFASILKREADGTFILESPAERGRIVVEDAPFLAVEMETSGAGAAQTLLLRTNVDDVVTVGTEHPLRFEVEAAAGGLKPYVRVRGRLEALVTRAVYYDLVELAAERDGKAGIWSGGVFFPLEGGPADGGTGP